MTNTPSWTEHDEVRLFPSVHITSEREAELRATASLLAAIRAVSEFGRRIVRLSNGPAGRLSCYTEIPFKFYGARDKAPEDLRPDGILTTKRGKTHWVAFVEVKVGTATLDQEQFDKYRRLAKQEGFHTLITVSNQPARGDGSPPLIIDRRLKISMVHFSWERLLSEAQVLSGKKGISDPDQKWILDEWIRYVDDKDSRIIVPPDLGPKWGEVLKAAQASVLEQSSPELQEVARCWVGYLRKAAFKLRAKLGVDVEVRMSRKERDNTDLQAQKSVKAREGTLNGILRIPGAAGDMTVKVILPSRSVQYTLRVAAPTEGRQKTRIKWLSRWLRTENLPSGGDLMTIADWTVRGLSTTARTHDYLEDTTRLCVDKDGAPVPRDAHPRSFQIVWTRSLSKKRGRSGAPILESISQGLEEFYVKVVQGIERFVPKAPQLATTEPEQEQEKPAAQQGDSDPKRQEAKDLDRESAPGE